MSKFHDIPPTVEDGSTAPPNNLPPIENAADLIAENLPHPPELIRGVLHMGSKLILGSSSKARKTWVLIDMALSVSTGLPFWKWQTTKGRVLYINFEIQRAFLRSRIKTVADAKGIKDTSNLDLWNLRGKAASLGTLLPELTGRIGQGYALVIIDPIYKGLGGRDENAAGDISELCNELERLAVESGAAVAFAAHFSKGNQSGKEAMDRIGGSGVFARDADAIVTLTKHQQEAALTADLILRNFPEQSPFAVRWNFPVMVVAEELNPEDLKQAGGRKASHTSDEAWKVLSDHGPAATVEWQRKCNDELGMGARTFYTLRKELERAGRIFKSKVEGDKWQAVTPRTK